MRARSNGHEDILRVSFVSERRLTFKDLLSESRESASSLDSSVFEQSHSDACISLSIDSLNNAQAPYLTPVN